MIDAVRWHQANADYLTAATAWLRLRLERLSHAAASPIIVPSGTAEATVAATHPAAAATAAPPFGGWRLFRWRAAPPPPQVATPPSSEPLPLPPPSPGPTDDQVAAALAAMQSAELNTDPPPALVVLGRLLGLTPFERDVLLLCVAMELDTRIGALCDRALGNHTATLDQRQPIA